MKLGMKKDITIVLLSTGMLFLTSCATTSSKIAFHEEITTKDKNDATVYVYRLPSFVGGGVTFPVRLDGKVVAILKQNAYAVLYTTPGEHRIIVGETPFGITGLIVEAAISKMGIFTAAPNGVYFLRRCGFSADFVTKEEAMKEIVEMKFDMGL